MKISQVRTTNMYESLRNGEYYVWKVLFVDGTSANVKIRWDETSQDNLEKHFGKSIDKIEYNFGIHGGNYPNQSDEYHAQQDKLEKNRTKPANQTLPSFNEENTLDKIDEISNELLTRYKSAAGKQATAADKKGEYAVGNKRFSGIIKATKKQFSNDAKQHTKEAGLGGINREPYPTNVSYEKVLDRNPKSAHSEVIGEFAQSDPEENWYGPEKSYQAAVGMAREHIGGPGEDGVNFRIIQIGNEFYWSESVPGAWDDEIYEKVCEKWNKEHINELSIDKLRAYKDAATSADVVKHAPLRKIAKHIQSAGTANRKINSKFDPQVLHAPSTNTYESRLKSIVDETENAYDYENLLKKQHKETLASKPKAKIVDIPFNDWTIRYRPAESSGKTDWMIIDRKGDEKHRASSLSDEDAVRDAESWIKSGGGTNRQSSSGVTIDFNVDFARAVAPDGGTFYATIDVDNDVPVLIVSYDQQKGLKTSHIRTQKYKETNETTKLPSISLTANEANAAKLQPNGRYVLGAKDIIDDNTMMFPLIYHSQVQDTGDKVALKSPGLTVATSRKLEENTSR